MTLPSFSQEGKVAIVTGSRRGLGKAMALAFAEAGADVSISDVVADDNLLEETAGEIRKLGRRVVVSHTDVTVKGQVESMVKNIIDELGCIDILVNNAGVASGVSLHHAFGEGDNFYEVFDVTVKGTAFCIDLRNVPVPGGFQGLARKISEEQEGE